MNPNTFLLASLDAEERRQRMVAAERAIRLSTRNRNPGPRGSSPSRVTSAFATLRERLGGWRATTVTSSTDGGQPAT